MDCQELVHPNETAWMIASTKTYRTAGEILHFGKDFGSGLSAYPRAETVRSIDWNLATSTEVPVKEIDIWSLQKKNQSSSPFCAAFLWVLTRSR